jgi:hypothetical protein
MGRSWLLTAGIVFFLPGRAAAIPVFARIYGQPCAACHTLYPQLNPAGERFRTQGLHGLDPVIKPIRVMDGLDIPGTIPLALSLAAGEDISQTKAPGRASPTNTHFNLEFLSLLIGGELGPYFAFLADYAPLFSIPQTGELKENTRIGLGFVQGHLDLWGWLMNLKLGLIELPLGSSPRVHRLSVQPYLTYNLTAGTILGKPPPVTSGRSDTLVLASTQIAAEWSGLDDASGRNLALGITDGSNNRFDNNGSKDVYTYLGQNFGLHRAGVFFLYSPDLLGQAPNDWAVRVGPDANFRFREWAVRTQFLAYYDSNPTGLRDGLWYYGSFIEGEYRFTPELLALSRVEYAWAPTFNDRSLGGTTYVHRRLWQLTGGLQYLLLENLKLIAEGTYGENHESINDAVAETWFVTVRMATAFWALTPPGLEKWPPSWWPK